MQQDQPFSRTYPLAKEAANPDTDPEVLVQLSKQKELWTFLAGNPATPAAILETLAKDGKESVQRAVACNPNGSLTTLLQLARTYPQDFLRNPVLPLLTLTQVDFMHKAPAIVWLHHLRTEHLPAFQLQWLQNHLRSLPFTTNALADVLERELAEHVALTGEASDDWEHEAKLKLQQYGNQQEGSNRSTGGNDVFLPVHVLNRSTGGNDVFLPAHVLIGIWMVFPELCASTLEKLDLLPFSQLSELVKHSQLLSYEQQDTLLQLISYHSQVIVPVEQARGSRTDRTLLAMALLTHPRVTNEMLHQFASSPESATRRLALAQPGADAELLHDALADPDPELHRQIAWHRHLAHTDQMMLAQDDDLETRRRVARAYYDDPNPEVLFALARDPDIKVREYLAANEYILVEALLMLVQDPEPKVRVALARNPALPAPALEQLALDSSPAVRGSIASNKGTPPHTLAMLATDELSPIRALVASHKQTPTSTLLSLARDTTPPIPIGLSSNRQLPLHLFTELAQSKDEEIRKQLASNPRTPHIVLEELFTIGDRSIWRILATNPQTPLGLLERLADVDDNETQRLVSSHPQASVQLLQHLAEMLPGMPDAQDSPENSAMLQARWLTLIDNPHTPLPVLMGVLGWSHWQDTFLGRVLANPAVQRERSRVMTGYLLSKLSQMLASYQSLPFRWFLLTHAQCPLMVLQPFAASLIWQERYLVAQHTATPQTLLQELVHDGNRYVRAAARNKLIHENFFQ